MERYCHAGDILFHGDCAGADILAESVGRRIGMHIVAFKANWNYYKKAAGPIRNRLMVTFSPDLVLAFHDDIDSSKGTKDMVNQAKAKCVKVLLFSHKSEKEQG